jgi:dipeptidyl aminopeptidase/acylaminoacyl peptidase
LEPQRRRIASVDIARFQQPDDVNLSPDGRWAAYLVTGMHLKTNDYESSVWLAPAEDEEPPRRLTGGGGADVHRRDRSPRWSPDSGQLAFVSDRGGSPELWLLDVRQGGEAEKISDLKGSISEPAWSPDGKWIAFALRPPKPEPAPVSDWLETGWRPGENQDVTTVTRLRYRFNGRGLLDERHQHLYVEHRETGRTWQVTFGEWDDSSPAWSPDGRWLAFVSSRRPDREIRPRSDVWAVDLEPVLRAAGASGQAPGQGPAQGPAQASRQAAESQSPGETELKAVRLSAEHTGSLGTPSWSPDGHWFLCTGTAEETGGAPNTHLWLIPFEHALGTGRARGAGGTEAEWAPVASSRWLDILASFDRSLVGGVRWSSWGAGGGSGGTPWIYFTAVDGGYCHLYRVRLPEGIPLEGYLPDIQRLTGAGDGGGCVLRLR